MTWSEAHDEMFCREILSLSPAIWDTLEGTPERAKAWALLATQLNQYTEPLFMVNVRSVRDHYNTLAKKWKRKQAKEVGESGTVQTETAIDLALKDIVPNMEEALQKKKTEKEEKSKKDDEEVLKAKEMREKSMTTYSLGDDDELDGPKSKRRRGKGSDAISYLKEKVEMELPLKQKEHELREKEIEEKREARKEANELRRQEIELWSQESKLIHQQ